MNKTALVLGAAGFIGGHTVSAFQRAGWRVFGAGRSPLPLNLMETSSYFQGDFRDREFVDQLLARAEPDRLIFLAGPASVHQSFADPVADFGSQTLPLAQVLDSARHMQRAPGVLLISSAAVYGNPAVVPVSEDATCSPISPYGFHKMQQEMLLTEYAHLYGLRTCKARVFSTYGDGLRHLAVWDITRRALNGDFTLHGTGMESRDYLHVADIANAVERICGAASFAGESINVASGVEARMDRIASLIYEALGISEQPSFAGACEEGKPLRWRAGVDRLRALGFSPQHTLESGIRQTVAWIRANA